ncbi:MAG TPA: prenyltransferase [Firmicutes bacterium]|nr:prenyltransferase [Bacillota bacterium]
MGWSKLLWQAIRGPFLIASGIPVLLGTAIAFAQQGTTRLFHFALALCGCMLLHAGANVANNYYDWLLGADGLKPAQRLSGGSSLLPSGQLAPERLKQLYRTMYSLAFLCGLIISSRVGPLALPIGFLGLIFGHGYTAPPTSFSYRGWGEVVTGITFGPLTVLGAYYTQTARLDWQPLLASLPLGLLITAVLYINEFPDHQTDKMAGKRTWVVLTGGRAIGIYQALIVLALVASLPLLFTSSPWVLGLYIGLALLGLQMVWQGKQVFFCKERLLRAQAKTIVFYSLTGLLLCVVYLHA